MCPTPCSSVLLPELMLVNALSTLTQHHVCKTYLGCLSAGSSRGRRAPRLVWFWRWAHLSCCLLPMAFLGSGIHPSLPCFIQHCLLGFCMQLFLNLHDKFLIASYSRTVAWTFWWRALSGQLELFFVTCICQRASQTGTSVFSHSLFSSPTLLSLKVYL